LRAQGWDIDIAAHVRRGGAVPGIRGACQMPGETIEDPGGIDGTPRTVAGPGLLPVTTRLTGDKRVIDVTGTSIRDDRPFAGYEIHVGLTRALSPVQPSLRLADGVLDGAVSPDGKIAGCYMHRLFDHLARRGAWLARPGAKSDGISREDRVDQALDALATGLEAHVDTDQLLAIAGHGT
jgi:adenosylcobyric acid synthase